MGLLQGKKVLIMGVANEKSIAWGIAQAFHKEGAQLGFTYAGEILEKRVRPLAESVGSDLVLSCDVTKDEDIQTLVKDVQKQWGHVDVLVHSIAFAKKEELKGDFYTTSREGFLLAMNISAYSLVAVTREFLPLMENRNSSILTLSYIGAEGVVPNYNMMGVAKSALENCVRYLSYDLGTKGVRVNCISAGPIRTLAAAGISGFWDLINHVEKIAPMKRSVTIEEVGKNALYLCTDLSAGVTGEVVHVDGGYHAMRI